MSAFRCVSNTIRLRSGLYLDLADPQPDQFTLEDIAGALSKICRFGGQIEHFYSVAEHCVHCAEQAAADGASTDAQVAALLHDAAEAFLGDVVKPLKVMLGDYGAIERLMESVIAKKFGIGAQFAEVVKEIDRAMLIAERRRLFSQDSVVWTGEQSVRRLRPCIGEWLPNVAEARFLSLAAKLGIGNAEDADPDDTALHVPDECPACEGMGRDASNRPCTPCGGTGKQHVHGGESGGA